MMTIDQAIRETLNEKRLPIREYLNQWQIHRHDVISLNVARKTREWITEPPVSRCTEKCEPVSFADIFAPSIKGVIFECRRDESLR